MQHRLVPRRAVQHRCRGLSRMATPTPCGLPWVAPEQQRLRWAVQHHMAPRRAVPHRCRGRSWSPTPTPRRLPWDAPEQQRLRYGDNEMHAAGNMDPAPATLKQSLARTLLINLCLLPMRPPHPPQRGPECKDNTHLVVPKQRPTTLIKPWSPGHPHDQNLEATPALATRRVPRGAQEGGT